MSGEQLLKHQPTFQACHSAPRVGDWPWGDTDGHGMIGAARGRPTGRRIAQPRCLPRAPMLGGSGGGLWRSACASEIHRREATRKQTTSSKSRDSVRLQLIQQVQSGAMTPEDAEAEAKRLGIAPLITQPDPAQFDPMNEVAWTLPMVAAWLAFRDVDAVRAWSPAYRSQLREWQPRFCTVTERIIGRDLVKAQSATLLNMATAYELDDNGIPPVSITAVMQCVKAAGMNGGLRATGISTRTGKRRVITRDEWQDLEYKQIGFETNARDVLRMKTDGKWLEHGFDAVTFSRDDVLSGWPAPGGAEQGAGPSPRL